MDASLPANRQMPEVTMTDCADAETDWRAWLPRAGGISFGIATQLLFAPTVCYVFLFLRDGAMRPASNWLSIDCLLAFQFAVPHSILLLPRVRSALSRVMPSQFYGSLFAASTCVSLWAIFVCWRSSPVLIWNAEGWSRIAIYAGFYASWAALIYSLKLVGLGYQSGWTQWMYWFRRQALPRREFVERNVYAWMRHPVYLSFLGLIWFTPHMTADHAILTGVWTVYIFVGSCLKDQRMAFYLGDTYHEYASRVPGYPGMFFGPLGKWRNAESARPNEDILVDAEL
jgi:protein-S-isoprenylcysteine O-methyltransferase Ste14